MLFDPLTLLASAAISAIVGTAFSLLTIATVTVRQVRAEAREKARLEIAAAVAPFRRELAQYAAGVSKKLQREADAAHGDDLVLLSEILAPIGVFGWVQRQMIRMRCRRLFGPAQLDVAELFGADAGATGMMVTKIARERKTGRRQSYVDGLLHRTLSGDPSARALARLARQFSRLASAL